MRQIVQRPTPLLLRMGGFGGPAQPSPTIAQCLNSGYPSKAVSVYRRPPN